MYVFMEQLLSQTPVGKFKQRIGQNLKSCVEKNMKPETVNTAKSMYKQKEYSYSHFMHKLREKCFIIYLQLLLKKN